ncbi:MAG: iron-containing alcohol dehydrogenase [Tumebacillaceae bacterium]
MNSSYLIEKRSLSVNNFAYYNSTKLIFGKGQLEALRTELPQYGASKVLVVYGGGSIKRSGLYDNVMSILNEMGLSVFEMSGVEPNPRLTTAQRGVDICKTEGIDFLLAVGGGSVIDCTKAIAAGAKYEGDVWEIIKDKVPFTEALPIGTVLTLAATGSEMNDVSVITKWDTQEKVGWGSPLVFPKFSILDPVNTFTVPLDQTVYGMVDMMSHTLEQYMSHTKEVPLQERFCESILQTVIETAPKLVADLQNYDYRATIMLCGTMAFNGTLDLGIEGDWGNHRIEHAISAVHDIPHGGGLAILFPNWMKYSIDENVQKFYQLATRVFHVDPTGKTEREVGLEGIERLRAFWNSIGAPSRLSDYGIGEDSIELMAEKAMFRGTFGGFHHLDKPDVIEILKMSL